PPPPRSFPHSPAVPAYLRWHRPPCSSNSHAVLVPPTSHGNFHPSAPVPPHALFVPVACDASAASAPDSTTLRPTSSAARSAHSLPPDRRSPSVPPLTSARTALLLPHQPHHSLAKFLWLPAVRLPPRAPVLQPLHSPFAIALGQALALPIAQ